VFAALGHPRRRYLLYTLVNGDSESTLGELAANIVAWERQKPTAAVTDDERQRVEAALYHAHVPKLVDLGVVEYDADAGVVAATSNADQVRAVLDGAGAEIDQRQERHAKTTDYDDTDADESE